MNDYETESKKPNTSAGKKKKNQNKTKQKSLFPPEEMSSQNFEEIENFPLTVKGHYKRKFVQAFDLVIEFLSDRFDQAQLENYADLQDLLMLAANKESYQEKLNKVVDFYERDLDKDRLKHQMDTFLQFLKRKKIWFLVTLLNTLRQWGQDKKPYSQKFVKS